MPGTNNDVANAPARLSNLVDAIIKASPKALLVLAPITPTGDNKRLIQNIWPTT